MNCSITTTLSKLTQSSQPDCRTKRTPAWESIVTLALPQVLGKVSTDKKFIATLAKKAVTACAEHCVTRATVAALVDAVNAKNLDLSEFAASALQALTKSADPAFFDVQFDAGLQIVGALCTVIEGKKTRMVKFA